MINIVEALTGTVAAAEAANPGEIAGAPPPAAPSTPAAGDSIAPGQTAFLALAYMPYATAGRASGVTAQARTAEAETDDALAAHFGPQYTLIRAALPSTLQQQFDAQLTAAYGTPPGGDAAAEEGNAAFSESDLARLALGSLRDADDAVSSVLVSRLAHDVARRGAGAVAQALGLAHERIAFSNAGAVPDPFVQARVIRREDHRRQQRRDYRPVPGETSALDRAGAPDGESGHDGGSPFSIRDVVYYNGAAVASSDTPLKLLLNERNAR